MKTPKLEQRGTPIQIDPQKGETIEMKVRRITQNKERDLFSGCSEIGTDRSPDRQ